MIAYAQTGTALAHSFVAKINAIILFPLITLLTALALLVFIWGGFQYVYNSGNDSKRTEGRKHMLWGVIGLLVMLSAYAILNIAANTFGIDTDKYNRPSSSLAPTSSSFPQQRPASAAGDGSTYAPINSATPSERPRTDSGVSSEQNRFDYIYVDLINKSVSVDLTISMVTRLQTTSNPAEAAQAFIDAELLSPAVVSRLRTDVGLD